MEKKRIYISIMRRRSNLLLFGVLFCLSFFFFVTAAIYRTADKNIEEIEKTYGSSFKIQIVRDELDENLWEERIIEGIEGNYGLKFYKGPNVDDNMLKRIAQIQGIKNYEAGRSWEVMLYDYDLIPGQHYNSYKFYLETPNPEHMMFTAEEIKNIIYLTECYPVRNSCNFNEFYNGVFQICEGRHIVETDVHKSLISQKFAERNQLSVGDKLTIDADSQNIRGGYPIESLGTVVTEIVGFFETTYQQQVTEYTQENDILENWVLVDSQTGLDLNHLYGESDNLYTGTFFVENPAELDNVMKAVKELDWIDWHYYRIFKDDSQYSSAVTPLRTMRVAMGVFMCVIIVVSVTVLLLIIIHSVKKRTREMGILLSIGLPGKKIRQQIIWEHLIIGLAAYLCAMLAGTVAVPVLGNQFYGILNKSSEQKVYTQEEIEAAIVRGEQSKVTQMAKNQQTGIQPPEAMEVQMSLIIVLSVLLAEGIIICLCVNTAIKKTLRLEPIRVLSMIE